MVPHQRGCDARSGWRTQVRQGQVDGRIDALVALAMALSLALLKAAKPIDIEALIG
jgi:hypothetical protein